jgi:hypothetical protein
MRKLRDRRPSAALIVAIVALVLAAAGTGAAAGVRITSSKQIKNGTIQTADLSKELRTLLSGRRGPSGPLGPPGVEGPKGDVGPSSAFAFFGPGPGMGPDISAVGDPGVTVATLSNLPAGAYAISAKATLGLPTMNTFLAVCILRAEGDTDLSSTTLGTTGTASSQAAVSLLLTHTFAGPGTTSLACSKAPGSPAGTFRALDIKLIAIKLGSETHTGP